MNEKCEKLKKIEDPWMCILETIFGPNALNTSADISAMNR